MKNSNIVKEAIEEILPRITEVIRETVQIECIYLFGSYAYGSPTEDSDIDLYVVLSNNTSVRPLDAVVQISGALRKAGIRFPMDILANYAAKFDEMCAGASIERVITTKGVLLYERFGKDKAVG